MRVKTFRAPDMKAALALVKAELGTDAVILSTQTVRENGGSVCEVMAALDETAQAAPAAKGEAPGYGDASWQREWGEIKGHLLALIRPQIDYSRVSPRQRLALEFLERQGVDEDIVLSLYRELASDKNALVLSLLGSRVGVTPLDAAHFPGKFQALAGPAGAGKTTAVIKLAVAHKKENPGAKICLVSAEGDKGKGAMALRHFAELSGFTFIEAGDPTRAAALPRLCQDFDRAFVLLPPLSRGQDLTGLIGELGLSETPGLAVHVVLNPHYSREQLAHFGRLYLSGTAQSLIWTKCDEACSFAAIINAAFRAGLPVSALGYGAGLRNSFAKASSETLWRLVFKHQTPDAQPHCAAAGE